MKLLKFKIIFTIVGILSLNIFLIDKVFAYQIINDFPGCGNIHLNDDNGHYIQNCQQRDCKDIFCSPIHGACNTAYTNTFISSGLSKDYRLCSSGSKSVTTVVDDKYKWTCQGNSCGSSANCQAKVMPQVGKCSSFFESGVNTMVQTFPTDNKFLCQRGNAINITQNGNSFTWKCEGSGGSVSSGLCALKVGDNGKAITDLILNPITKLDVTARITPPIVNRGEYCNIVDIDYNTNPGADTSLVSCNIFRNNVVYEDKDLNKTGHQVEPGFNYIFKCTDPVSGLTAQTNPLSCALNPIVNER